MREKKLSIRIDEKTTELMNDYENKHSVNWSRLIRKFILDTIKNGEKNAKNAS